MDEEQRKKMLEQNSSMIGVAQGPFRLGGGSIPAFPSNFSSINPVPATSPIRFGGGGTATMGLGGANVEYPSRLGISGGNYGTRFQFGADEFGPARLPQAQPINMLERQYTNPFRSPSERMGETLTLGLTQLPQTNRLPIDKGPLSMNIAAPQSAIAQDRQAIETPRGTIYATQEQAANLAAAPSRTLAQQSSRSPAEQQALIAQMRQRGIALAAQRSELMNNFAKTSREQRSADREKSSVALLGGTGFGEMQRQQAPPLPMLGSSFPFGGISGLGYGPIAEEQQRSRSRRRIRPQSNFVGRDSMGNPIVAIPDGRGGYVARNEETGGYSPYG